MLCLQMPISMVGWMVTKCTSCINKWCCFHYEMCKGGTYFAIPPNFTTVEKKLSMRSFLLFTTSLLQVLTPWAFQIRPNEIGSRLGNQIRNTSGSCCLLWINENWLKIWIELHIQAQQTSASKRTTALEKLNQRLMIKWSTS